MPKGFDVFDGSELMSGWTQGGLIPSKHSSQSSFLIMDPGAFGKLHALLKAAAKGNVPPGLAKDADDILAALDAPGQAAWKTKATDKDAQR